jgi:hypothetical protein
MFDRSRETVKLRKKCLMRFIQASQNTAFISQPFLFLTTLLSIHPMENPTLPERCLFSMTISDFIDTP